MTAKQYELSITFQSNPRLSTRPVTKIRLPLCLERRLYWALGYIYRSFLLFIFFCIFKSSFGIFGQIDQAFVLQLPVRCLVERLLGEDECSGEKFSQWTLESLVDVIGRDGVGSGWWGLSLGGGPYQNWKAAERNQDGNPVVRNHLSSRTFLQQHLTLLHGDVAGFLLNNRFFIELLMLAPLIMNFLMGSALINLCYHITLSKSISKT